MNWCINPNFCKCYAYTLLLLSFIAKISWVACQCAFGEGIPCTWANDKSALLKWQHKLGIDGNFIELTRCNYPECGVAIAVSPWLKPTDADRTVNLQYKIYGYSSVYLTVHFTSVDSQQPKLLSSVYGNYEDPFPTEWSTLTFTVPSSSSRYKLMLKANTPYRDAYVAVRGMSLSDTSSSNSFAISSPGPTSRPPDQQPIDQNDRKDENYDNNEVDGNDDGNRAEDYDLKTGQFGELGNSCGRNVPIFGGWGRF